MESSKRPFHPADPPHGMTNYDFGILTRNQKEKLNLVKMMQGRSNELYLYKHPEIKGLISILLRHMLINKSSSNLHRVAGIFFLRPRYKIAKDLLEYLLETACMGAIIDNLRKEIDDKDETDSSDSENLEDIALNVSNVGFSICEDQ